MIGHVTTSSNLSRHVRTSRLAHELSRRVQTSAELSRHVRNVTKDLYQHIPNYTYMFRHVQTRPDLSRPVPTCPVLYRPVRICTVLTEQPVLICPPVTDVS